MKQPVLIYDGHCALCNFFVKLVLQFDPGTVQFTSLQSETGKQLLQSFQIPKEVDSIVFIHSGKSYIYHEAVFEIARECGYPLKAILIFKVLPHFVNRKLYRMIAANRYRLFGKYDTCPLPPADKRNRFLP